MYGRGILFHRQYVWVKQFEWLFLVDLYSQNITISSSEPNELLKRNIYFISPHHHWKLQLIFLPPVNFINLSKSQALFHLNPHSEIICYFKEMLSGHFYAAALVNFKNHILFLVCDLHFENSKCRTSSRDQKSHHFNLLKTVKTENTLRKSSKRLSEEPKETENNQISSN